MQIMDHPKPEEVLPEPWKMNNPDLSPEAAAMLKLIVINVLRPDRVLVTIMHLVNITFKDDS